MENKKYYIQVAVAVVAIVAVVLIIRAVVSPPSAPSGQGPAATGTSAIPGAVPGATSVPQTSAGAVITSPAANSQWILQTQHTIAWSHGANSPGGIYLENAATGATVGWIQQQISPGQNNFPWNTRDLFVSRTSPLKEDVAPGNYRIVITFDYPNNPKLIGPVFSIITEAQAKAPTSTAAIQNAVFSPASITVTQGTQLTFANRDSVSYTLIPSAGGPSITLGPGATQTYDTSILSVGNYAFYSTAYPALRLTVTVTAKTY